MLCTTTTAANDALDENYCPIVMPDFDNMILLTREERIQLMDQALKDALSQVQDCRQRMSELQTQSSSNATDSGGSDSDSSDGSGDADNEEADNADNKDTAGEADSASDNASDGETQQNDNQRQTATPSSDLSGSEATEQPEASESPASDEANTSLPTQTAIPSGELSGSELPKPKSESSTGQSTDEQPPLTSPAVKDGKRALNNGKLPEDIPPVDNDDIIAQQIREAALAEPDPEKQAKLWNEYRRYKGISEK